MIFFSISLLWMIYQKSHFALLVPSDQSKLVEVTVTVAAINNAELDEAVEFRIQS